MSRISCLTSACLDAGLSVVVELGVAERVGFEVVVAWPHSGL